MKRSKSSFDDFSAKHTQCATLNKVVTCKDLHVGRERIKVETNLRDWFLLDWNQESVESKLNISKLFQSLFLIILICWKEIQLKYILVDVAIQDCQNFIVKTAWIWDLHYTRFWF